MESNRYCVNKPSVISEVIDGETIALNFESGHYYSFNRTASEIWLRICAGLPVATAAECVVQRFAGDPAAIRAEVAAFVRRLEDEQLIRRTPEAVAPPATTAAEAPSDPVATFSSPDFEKFTDMEELLLLDPIHEVGDSGWPRKPE
jgi:hypothetical protein